MKTCGFYTYGALNNDVQNYVQENGKVECAIMYRRMLMEWLSKQGYNFHLLNKKNDWKRQSRFDFLKDAPLFAQNDFYKHNKWVYKDGSLDLEASWRKMHKNINKVNWPKVDLVVIENMGYPFIPVFTLKLMIILAYKDKVPVLVLDDDDSTQPLLERAQKILKIDIDKDIYVGTHFKKKIFKNQVPYYIPYNPYIERKVLPVNKLENDLVYVGHDYDRREKMMKYYFDMVNEHPEVNVKVFGDWSKWLKTKRYSTLYPTSIFNGTVSQNAGYDILNKTLASVFVVPPYCEERGHITQRLVETAAVGCITLADKDIYTVEDYVLKDNIVSSLDETYAKLEEFKKQSFKQRKDMIEDQRNILRREFNIDKIMTDIFSIIYKK